MWQFRAHMFVAGGAVVLGVAGAAAHMPWVTYANAALFGANIVMAWMVRP